MDWFLESFKRNSTQLHWSLVMYDSIRKSIKGWAQSIAMCCSQVFSIPAQMIVPRFGIFNVIASATFLCSLALLLTSFVPSIAFLYVTYGFCFGIASAIATKPMVKLILEWVPVQYRMRATTIATTGGTIGVLTLSPVLGLIIVQVGWRWTYRICSALIFVFWLIAIPLIKLTPETNPINTQTQQQMSMSQKEEQETKQVSQRDVLRFPEMWMLAVTVAIISCAFGFTAINLVDFVTKTGFSLEQGALALSLNGGAELFSKLLLSIFMDKIRFPKMLLWPFGAIAGALTCFFMTVATTFDTILILSIALGLVRGIFNGSSYGVAAELFGHQYSASTASIVAPPAGIGYLMVALVSGFSYDLTGSYNNSLYACSAMCLIVAALALCTLVYQKTHAVERYQSMRRTSLAVTKIQRGGSYTYTAVQKNSSVV
ncbi:monocarboxylate transporter 12-B-like isoform X2 [Antedon mediterranea]|uniref:monocarboxylate transporter 12-B-like isoform X2 n=1 Tax=Antedon mediterranea TaxID=105859 RepID=UPI003AF67C0B